MKRSNHRRNRDRDRDQQRRPADATAAPVVDIWTAPADLPEFRPIDTTPNALALFRSLEAPPVHGQSDAIRYFEMVIERTTVISAALALSAGALSDTNF
jgi:hypothetical protein